MEFDTVTVSLLLLAPDAPDLSEAEEDALQDGHLAHLADLHESGELLVAGPVLGPPDRELRGLSLFRGADVERARALADADPMVAAGRMRHELHVWTFPAGLVSFTDGRLPRSVAEVMGG